MELQYLRPGTLVEAQDMIANAGERAGLLAGGTDLLVALRRNKLHVSTLVDVTRIEELQTMEVCGGRVVVGAGVTHRRIESSPLFQGALGALPEACSTVGSIQIRNVGTLGGNACNASPAADTPPVLLSFGASATIFGPNGVRNVPLEQFFVGYRRTALQPGEILQHVEFPLPDPGSGSAFVKLGRRKAMEISIACVGASVALDATGRVCREVRIGLGSLSATPVRAYRAEEYFRGCEISAQAFLAAGSIAAGEVAPISDVRANADYRQDVAGTLVERALTRAVERAASQLG